MTRTRSKTLAVSAAAGLLLAMAPVGVVSAMAQEPTPSIEVVTAVEQPGTATGESAASADPADLLAGDDATDSANEATDADDVGVAEPTDTATPTPTENVETPSAVAPAATVDEPTETATTEAPQIDYVTPPTVAGPGVGGEAIYPVGQPIPAWINVLDPYQNSGAWFTADQRQQAWANGDLTAVVTDPNGNPVPVAADGSFTPTVPGVHTVTYTYTSPVSHLSNSWTTTFNISKQMPELTTHDITVYAGEPFNLASLIQCIDQNGNPVDTSNYDVYAPMGLPVLNASETSVIWPVDLTNFAIPFPGEWHAWAAPFPCQLSDPGYGYVNITVLPSPTFPPASVDFQFSTPENTPVSFSPTDWLDRFGMNGTSLGWHMTVHCPQVGDNDVTFNDETLQFTVTPPPGFVGQLNCTFDANWFPGSWETEGAGAESITFTGTILINVTGDSTEPTEPTEPPTTEPPTTPPTTQPTTPPTQPTMPPSVTLPPQQAGGQRTIRLSNIPAGASAVRFIVTFPDGSTRVFTVPVGPNGEAVLTFDPTQIGAYSFVAVALGADGQPMRDAAGNELVIERGTFVETPRPGAGDGTTHPATGSASVGYAVGGLFAAAAGGLLLVNRNRRTVTSS